MPLLYTLALQEKNEQTNFLMVVSVRGPLTLAPHSYAWFQVNFSSGKPVIVEEQAESSRKAIIQFVGELSHVEHFDAHFVVLMGFSQGGIMSYSGALTAPDRIQGIVVMSGRLLPEIKPLVAPPDELKKLHLFISHGTNDQTLEYQYALDAEAYLRSFGPIALIKILPRRPPDQSTNANGY